MRWLDPGNFMERAMLKNTPDDVADLRDWDEIRRWAVEIAGALDAEAVRPARADTAGSPGHAGNSPVSEAGAALGAALVND